MSSSTGPSPEAADLLARAVDIATANAGESGGPFGAIVVARDGRIFEGVNRVTADLDPSAHAEVVAIRRACQGLGTFDLSGATLYASCEPCPMCLATALWARIDRVYFAADREDAATAGFDDARFYRYFEGMPEDRAILPVERIGLPDDGHTAPFVAWGRNDRRIEY
jgi:guanine deaminase